MKQATVKLPSGTYTIAESDKNGVVIFGTSMIGWQLLGADPVNLTAEEAGEIVESLTVQVEIPQRAAGFGWYTKFKNYQSDNQFSDSFWIPTASLDSLAQSFGVSKPYVVLKHVGE